MKNLMETISFSVVLIIIALSLISISILLTGRQRIKSGTCGKIPPKKKGDPCKGGGKCDLCEFGPEKKKETNENEAENDKDDNDENK